MRLREVYAEEFSISSMAPRAECCPVCCFGFCLALVRNDLAKKQKTKTTKKKPKAQVFFGGGLKQRIIYSAWDWAGWSSEYPDVAVDVLVHCRGVGRGDL